MNYPTEQMMGDKEYSMKMAAARQLGVGQIGGAQHDAINQMPLRDKPPVEVSAQRLFERLGQLQAEVDQLTERLAPVSRSESVGDGKDTGRGPTECQLVEMLDQAAERVEHAINRLGNARNRLCI